MSDSILISEEYILVIDTNTNAQFSKALCAYCTGYGSEVGDLKEDCGGDLEQQMSDMFYMEMGLEDDDSPKGRVALQKSPFYESIVDHRDEYGDYSPCSIWLNRNYGCNEAGEFAKLTDENFSDYDQPAPCSVGIFFGVEPSTDQIKIIKERAVKFFKEMWPKLTGNKALGISSQQVEVEGFRLISHKKYGEEKEI